MDHIFEDSLNNSLVGVKGKQLEAWDYEFNEDGDIINLILRFEGGKSIIISKSTGGFGVLFQRETR